MKVAPIHHLELGQFTKVRNTLLTNYLWTE